MCLGAVKKILRLWGRLMERSWHSLYSSFSYSDNRKNDKATELHERFKFRQATGKCSSGIADPEGGGRIQAHIERQIQEKGSAMWCCSRYL